jgi:hypothetical protein
MTSLQSGRGTPIRERYKGGLQGRGFGFVAIGERVGALSKTAVFEELD